MLRLVIYACIFAVVVIVLLLPDADGWPIQVVQDMTSNSSAVDEAHELYGQIRTKICNNPVPKLFPIDEMYNINNGLFKPHCVELHRCNNDAGCCESNYICAPIETETVRLNIFVSGLNENKVLLMPFKNHTKCDCKERGEVPIEQMSLVILELDI